MHFRDAPERVFGSRAKIRVLRTLYSMREEELTGREIARRCQLTPARTHAVLKELAGEGLVRMRVLGRNHMYTFNSNSILMPSIKQIFDPAYSVESQLKRVTSEELADKRVLSALTYGEKLSTPDSPSGRLKIMIIADSETAFVPLAKKMDSLKARIRGSFGEESLLSIQTVDQLRNKAQNDDPEVRSALVNHILLTGEPPGNLTSEKRHSQRFRFPLFRRQ